MKSLRAYSAEEVRQLVEIFRLSGDASAAELSGMEKLATVLDQWETMSDSEIEAEVLSRIRSVAA